MILLNLGQIFYISSYLTVLCNALAVNFNTLILMYLAILILRPVRIARQAGQESSYIETRAIDASISQFVYIIMLVVLVSVSQFICGN